MTASGKATTTAMRNNPMRFARACQLSWRGDAIRVMRASIGRFARFLSLGGSRPRDVSPGEGEAAVLEAALGHPGPGVGRAPPGHVGPAQAIRCRDPADDLPDACGVDGVARPRARVVL